MIFIVLRAEISPEKRDDWLAAIEPVLHLRHRQPGQHEQQPQPRFHGRLGAGIGQRTTR